MTYVLVGKGQMLEIGEVSKTDAIKSCLKYFGVAIEKDSATKNTYYACRTGGGKVHIIKAPTIIKAAEKLLGRNGYKLKKVTYDWLSRRTY